MFIKICGTSSEEDALLSVALGADAVGFVFAPSARQVTVEAASDIIKRLPQEILPVGVFRNAPAAQIRDGVVESGVRAVQLHGVETPAEVKAIRKALSVPVWKAIDATKEHLGRVEKYGADVVLTDSRNPGSGMSFDWGRLQHVPEGVRIMLAGGLRPDNVSSAIAQVRPWGVDVATGVESRPGKKDPRKLREFITRARAAAAQMEASVVSPDDAVNDGDARTVARYRSELESEKESMHASHQLQGASVFYDWEKE